MSNRIVSRGRTLSVATVIFLAGALLAGGAWGQQTRVFVTSTTQNGALGGLAGADGICQQLGATVDPGATWIAWLSTSTTDAASRLTTTGPFVRATSPATIIADDLADLLDGTLDNPILLDETGADLTAMTENTWTGTSAAGTALPETCNDWTDSSPMVEGRYGELDEDDDEWVDCSVASCDTPQRLYCFEAPAMAPAAPPAGMALLALLLLGGGAYVLRRRLV